MSPASRRAPLVLAVLSAAPVWAQEAVEPATRWQGWKDIGPAIELKELDGPEDVVEKADIIRDRIDALDRERERLVAVQGEARARVRAIEAEREHLEDLASLHAKPDRAFRQRLHSLHERLQRARHRVAMIGGSLEALATELGRLRALDESYQRRARRLGEEEAKRR